MPEFANQTVVVAFAHVEVDRWRVLRLLRLESARWRFDHLGKFDTGFMGKEEQRQFWPGTKPEMTKCYELSAADIAQVEQLLSFSVS